jgi:hypothetical protein
MTISPYPALPSRQDGSANKKEPSMDTSHVSALQLKHAGLEKKIETELNRPMPDDAAIQTLKKQKLRIKEQLDRA